jgi:CheY-like chemotaxis protein
MWGGGDIMPQSSGNDAGIESERAPARVVLAESDPAVRALELDWLEGGDWCTVTVVASGEETLEVVDDRVDLLVLGRLFEDIRGGQLLSRLGETSFDGKVVVCSACPPDGRLGEADVDAYLTKPIGREAFVDRVSSLAPSG